MRLIPFRSRSFNWPQGGAAALALMLMASVSLAATNYVHCGHSLALDTGPHEKPRLMEGIGKTHFPITASVPEVQQWFDQGNTLLHCFWYNEAERAFRWCIKLDPDCAMAYWGLGRAILADAITGNGDKRAEAMMEEAVKRAGKASERERLYIEAWAALWDAKNHDHYLLLEQICLKYPDDIEAKCLLARENLGKENRYGNDAILREVLAAAPDHVGAHHYRIHTWDGGDEASRTALDSCAALQRIAPMAAHAQHMPGHIYCGLGMWHEAAIAMETSARVEARYLRDNMVMPFAEWNYAHNRNYLSYVQEQLGMAEAAIEGADELLGVARDPDRNSGEDAHSVFTNGKLALARALVKFERWREILAPGRIPWGESVSDRMWRSYCESLALMGSGKLKEAAVRVSQHAALQSKIDKFQDDDLETIYSIQRRELEARLKLRRGEQRAGLRLLEEAARRELAFRADHRDPPLYPVCLYTVLGSALLADGRTTEAVPAFQKTLGAMPNDLFALAGLAETEAALNNAERARKTLSSLLFVASDADTDLPWLEHVKSVAKDARAVDVALPHQRLYHSVTLDAVGPRAWEPSPAPALDTLDAAGKRMTMADYRGKNVLLIFVRDDKPSAGLAQLAKLAKHQSDFHKLNTEVLAISSGPAIFGGEYNSKIAAKFRFLSDPQFENARRFKAYDEFEDSPVDATILIDSRGLIRWARQGGAPFGDVSFLLNEIRQSDEAPAPTPKDSQAGFQAGKKFE